MPVYRLLVAYDGAPFHGFARQPGLDTVQGTIESALAKLFGSDVKTSAAGRTDAGVHALGQVMSFVTEQTKDLEELQRRLNSLCGPSISIVEIDFAPEGFDARFSAVARTYEYGIFTRAVHDPFCRFTTLHHPEPLNIELMGAGARALIGEHSFESFGRIEEGQSPVRRIESIDIEHDGDLVSIRITANSFIQQMVRSIVGTLVKVGEGKIHPDDVDTILHARDRAAAAPVAPPHGLFLVSVSYPEQLVVVNGVASAAMIDASQTDSNDR
ncbi:MAG: tRNA pseudouridine(38-40) synthase TruA [Actinomycetota bacterium]|nr:tRNA pseudouridine(38-40) synthase TruA [Actinomycetota bacterium]